MPEGMGYPPMMSGQPAQRTPEEGVPMWERIKRMLPGMLTGKQTGDMRLPMEAFTERDPRLPPESGFEAIRSGLEQVHDIGKTPMTGQEEAAMSAIERMARGLRKPGQ